MIFVDSSAWFAVYPLRDANHAVAAQAIRSFREPLFTADFIVDETLTLLRARSENPRALAFGKQIIEGPSTTVVTIDDQDFVRAWEMFQRFGDKEWSFTDCTSLIVMQRLGIQRAFSFDNHFRQFGTVVVVP